MDFRRFLIENPAKVVDFIKKHPEYHPRLKEVVEQDLNLYPRYLELLDYPNIANYIDLYDLYELGLKYLTPSVHHVPDAVYSKVVYRFLADFILTHKQVLYDNDKNLISTYLLRAGNFSESDELKRRLEWEWAGNPPGSYPRRQPTKAQLAEWGFVLSDAQLREYDELMRSTNK